MRKFEQLAGFESTIPQRATDMSAGYDLRSAVALTIYPNETVLVDTGLTIEMNRYDDCQIRPRSGLAYKYGIIVLNSPGTIDADYYPNHVKVMLKNTGNKPFEIEVGDRIAQAVFSSYLITSDDEPVERKRTGGFGHTGV